MLLAVFMERMMQKPPGLVCARCHGALTDHGRELECVACHARYAVLDGIPSFLLTPPDAPIAAAACELSVMIPVIDEALNLTALLPRLVGMLQSLGASHEVLVIDGSSRDGSPEVARRYGARVVTQELPGFGGAMRTGFTHARGTYIINLDADGSHDPTWVAKLWAARSTAEVVIASRYVPGGRADMPWWRLLLSRILNFGFRLGLSLPVADLSNSYRLYARAAVRQLDLQGTNFDILEEILIRALAAGYTVRELPFHYTPRLHGRSHAQLIKFGISYLRTFWAMWKLRNSIANGDYDARAYDSLMPLQRYWQRRRVALITELAAGFERVLDAGCGSSRVLSTDSGLVGLDIDLSRLRYARRYGNRLVHGSILALPFADAAFDCVICSQVIQHMPPEARLFDELLRVLKPGGRLVLGTPDFDRRSWRALEWLHRRLVPGREPGQRLTQYGRAGLTAYLLGRGLTVERIRYVGGSEMVMSLRKQAQASSSAQPPPLTVALRAGRAA